MKYLAVFCLFALASLGRCQTTTVIGNSGQPPTTSGHVPFLIPTVVLDTAGNPYTVHDWDEPGYKIDRWNPATGEVAWHSTGIINDQLDSIAVEPDGTYAYTTGWNGSAGNFTLDIWKTNLTTGATLAWGSGSQTIKAQTGSTIATLPIALSGQDLWVTARDANTVEEYDKVSGSLITSFSVTAPFGIAVDGSGNLWIGTGTSVSVYSAAGTLLATPITGLSSVHCLSIGGSTLYVADQGASTIDEYTISGTAATFVKNIGYPAHPGESSGNAIHTLNSVATNAAGALIFSEYVNGGSRLHSIAPSVWNASCTEFQANAASSAANPNIIVGGYRDVYSVQPGGAVYWANARTDNASYFGTIPNTTGGTPRVLTLGGNDFYYFPSGSGNMAIYRVAPTRSGWGPALQFAGALALCSPGADGVNYPPSQMKYQWSWNDTTGPGLTSVNASTNLLNDPGTTINWGPNNPYNTLSTAGMDVDDAGTIWLSVLYYGRAGVPNPYGGSVWAIPLHGLNSAGNPVYLWSEAVQVVDNTTLCNAIGVAPGTNGANPSAVNLSLIDGQLYVLAINPNGAPRNWMDGNTLLAFTCTGPSPVTGLAWSKALSNYAVGLSPVPLSTGGFVTGQNIGLNGGLVVQRYDKNGNLTATYSPPSQFGNSSIDNPCGAGDTFGCVNACLETSGFSIFAEDDFNGRVFRYNIPN